MSCRCYYCGWSGELDERVPATEEWIFEHDVDRDHFLNHGLNCPDCGEAQWLLSGDDAEY